MIRKPKLDAKRLTTGVLVAGVVAAGAVALAGPASAAAATTLSITPKTADAGTGTCVTYTVAELGGDGKAATSGTFTPTVTLTPSTGVTTPTYGSTPGCTDSTVTAGDGATYTFGVKATTASSGTVTIKASNSAGTINTSATLNVAANVNDFVKSFTVAPTGGVTADANGIAPYLVTPLDANGNPVLGATVLYQTSATDTDNACTGDSETLPAGTIECDVAAGAASSTVTFYVNNSSSTSTGLDSGEPSSTPSAITVQAAKTVDDVTVTCTNQGANGDGSNTDCLVPTGTKSETFTATVQNTPTGSHTEAPVSGAVVTFSVIESNGTLNTLTATTNASGVATVTLTPSSTTADETDTVQATSGGTSDSADVSFETAEDTNLVITPGSRNALNGATITETATLTDQFGTPIANRYVEVYTDGDSRNDAYIEKQTDANGQVTLSYKDGAVVDDASSTSDTIRADEDDFNGVEADPVTVSYLASVTPSKITENFVDNPNDESSPSANPTSCPAPTGTAANIDPQTTAGQAQEVCAQVANSTGNFLQGESVTFTVSQGTVGLTAAAAQAAGATVSVQATADSNGIAIAYVSATKAAAQTVTATDGAATSNTLTDTYQADEDGFHVTLTPTSTQVVAGTNQQFTAAVTDEYGNPLDESGEDPFEAEVLFSQSGPGTLSSSFAILSSSGTASTTLETSTGQTGPGTVTAQLADAPNEAQYSATSSYTVSPVVAKSVQVQLSGAGKIGAAGTATATLTGTDGKSVSGELVNFAVTGATATTGSATTNGNGVATFNFTAKHAGSFTVTATATSASVSGTATGSTAKTTVSTALSLASTHTRQIMETATTSLKKAGLTVHFYSVSSNGTKTYVASATTNANGVATHVVKALKSGTTYQASAKAVGLSSDYAAVSSATKSHKVS